MTPAFHLHDRHILVTGASSGIGKAVALMIAQMGGQLTITGRDHARLQETLSNLSGTGHRMLTADLMEGEERDALVRDVAAVDGVVHSAGMVRAFPIKFIGTRQLEHIMGINYDAIVLLTAGLFKAKKIQPGASFVFMSSIAAKYPHKGGALYAGAKAAINAYSKTLALEYADKKIRSNVLMAAMVETPLFDKVEMAIGKDQMAAHGAAYPLGFGRPEDLAHAACFFLSDASRWITGTELLMDGGLSAGT